MEAMLRTVGVVMVGTVGGMVVAVILGDMEEDIDNSHGFRRPFSRLLLTRRLPWNSRQENGKDTIAGISRSSH